MNGVKSGWRSSEFWSTLISQGMAFVVLLGLVKHTDAAALGDALTQIVTSAFVIAANAAIVVQYIRGRVELKKGGE